MECLLRKINGRMKCTYFIADQFVLADIVCNCSSTVLPYVGGNTWAVRD